MRAPVGRLRRRPGSLSRSAGLGAFAALFVAGVAASAQEQDRKDVAAKPAAVPAKVLSLSSPIDEAVIGQVQNVALALQAQAEKSGKQAVLVLEVPPGTS